MANNMYYSILTTVGTEKLAQAIITEIPVKLTTIAVGDGNGQYYEPTPDQTQLKRETWRGNINDLRSAEDAQNKVLAEGVVPINVGGWTVREVALFDDSGALIAIGNYPDTIKPMPTSGSGKQLYIQIIINIDNVAALELIVDESVVLASRYYVDQKFLELAGPDGSKKLGYQATANSFLRSAYDRMRESVSLQDYWIASDGNDYAPALRRAMADGNVIKVPNKFHLIKSTVVLSDNILIYGSGKYSTLGSPTATTSSGGSVVTVLSAQGASNIAFLNLSIDGGCNDLVVKSYTRGVRLINCKNIVMKNVLIANTCDWAISFESCNGVYVTDYTHYNDYLNYPGGRDGFHLMDCDNVYVNGAVIQSGDDCIGITTQTKASRNINISNVVGSSKIASLVIYNEEYSVTNPPEYAVTTMDGLSISNVALLDGGKTRNVIRVVKYNPLSTIKNVSITGIRGAATNHGIQLGGISSLHVSDVNTTSTGQHGVYFANCSDVTGDVSGQSLMAGYDGVNMFNSIYVNMVASSVNSASFGVHMNGLIDANIIIKATNCGGVVFGNKTGGGARVVNCKKINIPSGMMVGDVSSSYYGLLIASGNTDLTVAYGVNMRGFINHTALGMKTTVQQIRVSCKFKEDSVGVIHNFIMFGCMITRNATGSYTVTFNESLSSAVYQVIPAVYHNNQLRNFKLNGPQTETGFSFYAVDKNDNPIYTDHIGFIIYEDR